MSLGSTETMGESVRDPEGGGLSIGIPMADGDQEMDPSSPSRVTTTTIKNIYKEQKGRNRKIKTKKQTDDEIN